MGYPKKIKELHSCKLNRNIMLETQTNSSQTVIKIKTFFFTQKPLKTQCQCPAHHAAHMRRYPETKPGRQSSTLMIIHISLFMYHSIPVYLFFLIRYPSKLSIPYLDQSQKSSPYSSQSPNFHLTCLQLLSECCAIFFSNFLPISVWNCTGFFPDKLPLFFCTIFPDFSVCCTNPTSFLLFLSSPVSLSLCQRPASNILFSVTRRSRSDGGESLSH